MRESRVLGKVVALLRRHRIQTRLLVAFLAVSLIPILLFGALAYSVYGASVHARVSEYAEQSMRLLNRSLELELEPYGVSISALSVSDELNQLLSAADSSGTVQADWKRRVEVSGVSAYGVGNYLRDVQVFSAEGDLLYSAGYESATSEEIASILAMLDNASPRDGLRYLPGRGFSGNLVLGRKLYHYSPSLKPKGYLLLYISARFLQDEILSGIDFGPDSQALLLGADGAVMASSGNLGAEDVRQALLRNDLGRAPSFTMRLGGKDYLVIQNKSAVYDCTFAAVIPSGYIQRETRQIALGLALLIAVLFCVSFAAMLLVYCSIVQPINGIVAHCRNDISKLERSIGDHCPDEVGFLARTIDGLIVRLTDMARKQKEDEERKRELELESLQYQINPHFLFNTLNTLKWLASLNGVPVVHDGIDSLSALLQSTLMTKDTLLTLREELDNLAHYFSIQRIRYADCFDVRYEVDETLHDISVPRFILQPLAENAILHGTDDSGRIVVITVSARVGAERTVVLSVADDGVGFDPSALPRREHFSGIGLSNVDERIRLYYGPDYGVEVRSSPGCGTVCTIRLPLRRVEKEDRSDV